MVTYERIQIVGVIGMCEFFPGTHKDFFKLRVCPGERKIRGQPTTIWYNVIVPMDQIKDPDLFVRMHAKGRLVICEGVPTAEAFLDKTTGLPRAEITLACRNLPTLLDSPNKAR